MPTLEDKYTLEEGTVFLTGVQALVRVVLDQRRADRRRGLDTAGFVSGYQGSPLAGFDTELGRARRHLEAEGVVHQPGLNEELAATSVLGSQLAADRPGARHEGVFGLWYGKGPGFDRASDAIKHANYIGAHHKGGVLAVVGDDAACKSSTLPSASETALYDCLMPVLFPGTPQEVLEFGQHAIALSRASGLWAGMKLATEVADGFATVAVSPDLVQPVLPEMTLDGRPYEHVVDARLLAPVPQQLERSLVHARLAAAGDYARLNGLNRIVARGERDRLGIVAAGKTYVDLRQALRDLGLDDDALAELGIRLLHVGMLFPLDGEIVRECADGLEQLLVIEEKRPFLELLVKDALSGVAGAPPVLGKHDEQGRPLVPAELDLDPDRIALVLGERLLAHHDLPAMRARLDQIAARAKAAPAPLPLSRTPYFCSGCPHSSSTKVPEGATVAAGIGCHGMVMLMREDQVGDVIGAVQMGGEGSQWIGMAPFVEQPHIFQDVGDGTFLHSGSLGIRATVAAGVNITYKLLYNSAVAMTGGQTAVGLMTVPQITELLHAEGARRVIVTTEDLGRYEGVRLHGNAEAWDRSRIVEAQELLARTPGVTVLIHDQECAAEKRRKRKRGKLEDPATRIFINERVCEGCGDCGVKSNCMSVQPVETELGRKTWIHQPSCNKDYSCIDGDCPSFLTIVPAKGGRRRATVSALDPAALPEPELRVDAERFAMRITGVGGTGVLTVSQILGVAALLEGRSVRGLDQTGLAQKGGPVVSDVKIARGGSEEQASRAVAGEAQLYLGCDVLVASEARHLIAADPERTIALVSSAEVPTGRMVVDTAAAFPDPGLLLERIERRTRSLTVLDASALTRDLFGSDQTANVLLLGAAYQLGAIPCGAAAIEQAIGLNGTAVETNVEAFRRGRQSVADPEALERDRAALQRPAAAAPAPAPAAAAALAATVRTDDDSELAALVRRRAADLVAYQDEDYARAYVELVERVRAAEARRVPSSEGLAEAVAFNLYKLMAYKDEYEVARLQLDPALDAAIEAEFGPGARRAWKLHPPLLRALGMNRKLTLGPWFRPAFRALRAMRRLRGTPLDVFGYAHVRRVERELLGEYRATVEHLLERLSAENLSTAIAIAALPDVVRGYEEIKLANVERYRRELSALRARFDGAQGEPLLAVHEVKA